MLFRSIFETYLDPVEPEREEPQEVIAEGNDTETLAAAMNATPLKKSKKAASPSSTPQRRSKAKFVPGIYGLDTRLAPVAAFTFLLCIFVLHCTWVTSTAYSSPSVVLASKNQDGSQNIIDDFREAYYWLRQNTKEDAKIMSWWDYGYQIADRKSVV